MPAGTFAKSSVVAPLSHAYVYGGVPPLTFTSILPVLSPKQATSVNVPMTTSIKTTSAVTLLSQLVLISFTVISYEPSPRPEKAVDA